MQWNTLLKISSSTTSFSLVMINGAIFYCLLFGRKQQVSFLATTSGLYPIYCGVLQGSILCPHLFLLHFSDAVETLLHCGIVMYARDTVVFCADKDIDVIQKRVEENFQLTN